MQEHVVGGSGSEKSRKRSFLGSRKGQGSGGGDAFSEIQNYFRRPPGG